jgi:suppressor of G2 allele of SKP1
LFRIACFRLEEFEAAKEAFDAGAKIAPENPQFKTWARKCQAELAGMSWELVP